MFVDNFQKSAHEFFALYPRSSCCKTIFFSFIGFLINAGPNINVLTVSSGMSATKLRLKSAGTNFPFDKSHKTPPTIGSGLDLD